MPGKELVQGVERGEDQDREHEPWEISIEIFF